jgi:hypothetical protein
LLATFQKLSVWLSCIVGGHQQAEDLRATGLI